jgi:hypothetical protein
MTQRQRKLVGIILTIIYIPVYSLLAMVLGVRLAVDQGKLVELIYFAVAGTAWLPLEMAIIRWMSRPD